MDSELCLEKVTLATHAMCVSQQKSQWNQSSTLHANLSEIATLRVALKPTFAWKNDTTSTVLLKREKLWTMQC